MSSISRRDFLRVSTTAAAGALLAACGQAQPTAAPATEAPQAEEKATEAPKGPERPKTWPLGDVPRNRTLIRANGSITPEMCNPMMSGFNHQAGFSLILEPCAFYGVHADKNYMWLAESYKMNEDATVYDIVFRKGIKWSDGTPFTAKDVAFGMTKLATVEGLNRAGTYKAELDKAEAVDDLNLKVTLKQSDFRFFFKSLTFRFDLGDESVIVPEHIFKDIPDAELTTFKFYDVAKGWPVTTAAYGVTNTTDQVTQMDLRPSWWAVETGFVEKEPEVWRSLNVPFTSDTLAAQQVLNNEIDCSLDMRPLTIASVLAQTDHVITWTGKKPPYGYVDWWPISVQFCTQKPPFDNPKVRHAVQSALDRQQLVDTAWGGAGYINLTPFPGYPKMKKYVEGIQDILEKYKIGVKDLDRTASLMQEAGFTKDAEGFWVDKDGVRPDADIYAGVPLFADLAPIIAEQLRNAGFQSEHKAPPDVWAAKVDGRASMFLFGHGGATIDPFDTFNNMYPQSGIAKMGEQSWSNITRWSPDDFWALVQEMNVTAMDDPKMTDLFHQIMEIWYRDLPDAPIVEWFHRIPQNTYYWDNWATAENPYMNSAPWHLTQLLMTIYFKPTGK